jgi:serine phosphatase RsbU (regulator of sigma subunit)
VSLRARLIISFLLLSVVPLAAVTTYSYVTSYKALQDAATHEADQLAAELSQRMQLVTAQLSQRVERFMEMSATQAETEPEKPKVPVDGGSREGPPKAAPRTERPSEPAVPEMTMARDQAADALGAAAMLLNSVELHGFRGRRGPRPEPFVGPLQPGSRAGGRGRFGGPDEGRRGSEAVAIPPAEAGAPRAGIPSGPRPPQPPGAPPTPQMSGDQQDDRIRIDVGPIAQDVFRQLMPEGTNPNDLTPEQRQRVGAEINQRMLGITQGLRMAAEELQRKADEARKKAEEAKAVEKANKTVQSKTTAPLKRRSALTGNRLDITVEENGKVVRTANAEINLPNVLMTVFSSMHPAQGEVPFAVGRDGRLYTPAMKNRAALEQIAPARLKDGASMQNDWIVVMTPDPTGSGLRLGIARPVADSLSALRKATGRNAALGGLFIGLSIALIVPLSGRLTRNLTLLTDAVKRFASGEYATRVRLKTHDEIGQLATAFNQMAGDVEAHQRAIVEQERLKRELELGRQIQHDMQPQGPLRLGFAEVQGVSVPAREVGGDFFNYFLLPGGEVALLVGDVSGKGVGAALLMANIQASLRTRFAVSQNLSAIADAIDRDIEANSPGQMFATIFLGVLIPGTRELRYVNAGHHPQYVIRSGGGLVRMGATGLPAGLLAGRGYSEERVQLDEGDLIFFYTDGCPETENDRDEMFGAERLEALLQSTSRSDPNNVLQRVESALKSFRGTREPFDDATMMAVRINIEVGSSIIDHRN